MKLAPHQIEQIKSWISKRGFTHTDVQYEIIDHVASAIESKMEENPDIELEDAFSQVHKSFGIFGFAEIEEAIVNRLNKELLHSYWQALLAIFSTKRMLIPSLIIVILSLVSVRLPEYFDLVVQGLLMAFMTLYLTYTYITYRSKKYLKNYISFKAAFAIVPLLAVNVFNLRFLYLDKANQFLPLFLISIIIFSVYAVHLGSQRIIEKTDRLHKLYKD
ncbi:hypothetical protein [Marivirga harenae]|uniref:hypothetical protein n=1 Tax=Marivirga harenae TaxID=2010992 RepID=UPI0026E0BEF8|nr:hypothetical protein [Marivirga harenae]WKV11680.1 hypothetical protein Q3Y49_15870 [Marivirga harenae]|tara:strand:+ start:186492 stop:187145 length:654 start_codon:yes stop_codon:yes gene_type:complete